MWSPESKWSEKSSINDFEKGANAFIMRSDLKTIQAFSHWPVWIWNVTDSSTAGTFWLLTVYFGCVRNSHSKSRTYIKRYVIFIIFSKWIDTDRGKQPHQSIDVIQFRLVTKKSIWKKLGLFLGRYRIDSFVRPRLRSDRPVPPQRAI